MTKISKFLLFIFCLICLFCYIGSVNAAVDSNQGDRFKFMTNLGLSQSDLIKWYTGSGTTSYQFKTTNTDNMWDLNDYDYLIGNIKYFSTLNYQVYTTDLNLDTVCDLTTYYSASGTITYPDNTQSDIDFTRLSAYCDGGYTTTDNNIELRQYNIDNKPNINVFIINQFNVEYPCEMTSDTTFKCYIPKRYKISGITVSTSYSGLGMTHYLALNNVLYLFTNDTTQLINNQNQNTNTINNSITNINDNITSDNITGNNSSDSITSISNSFSSSNDFILNLFTLPYNFITTIMNGVSDSCTPISLGTIFNYELVMPCINLNNWLGNVWTNIVDVVLAGMLSFAFRKRIHDFFFAIIRLDRNAANIGGVEIL